MPSIKRSLRVAGLLTPLLLTACAIPHYRPEPNEKAAHVRLMGQGVLSMCRAHLQYQLPVHEDEQGRRWTDLPVGERVELIEYISIGYGGGSAVCTARASVMPSEGITLIVNSTTPAYNTCGLEIVREDENAKTGLSVEPSVQSSLPPKRQKVPPVNLGAPSC